LRAFLVKLTLVGAAAFGAGCGGSAGKPSASLDCAYLESDNCWKTVTSTAASCLPGSSETGTLSADGRTCSYASGDVVTFTPPLVLPRTVLTWNFTVTTASGASCLSYQDDGHGNVTLTSQGETVEATTPGGPAIAITCPDGTSYSNPSGFNSMSCPDASLFSLLPAATGSSTSTIVDFSLTATASSPYGSEVVFTCQKAPS
jgi:hypothetical protein